MVVSSSPTSDVKAAGRSSWREQGCLSDNVTPAVTAGAMSPKPVHLVEFVQIAGKVATQEILG